jgi:hypothetical protein
MVAPFGIFMVHPFKRIMEENADVRVKQNVTGCIALLSGFMIRPA